MIVAIRIAGKVGIDSHVEETLNRMRLRKKYVAVILEDNENNRKLILRVRNFIAYGKISEETFAKLMEKRAQGINGKKVDFSKITLADAKDLEKKNVKPFFRLHPPRKGIESKKHFGKGKGVLGDNKEAINQLLERML